MTARTGLTGRASEPDGAAADAAAPAQEPPPVPRTPRGHRLAVPLLAAALVLIALLALALGRYTVPPNEVARILLDRLVSMTGLSGIADIRHTWTDAEETVVLSVRFPRVALAVLVGGALAISGAVLQALFQNPLVSPDIIGVSSGASFGGVLVIMAGLGSSAMIGGTFLGGLLALSFVMLLGRVRGGNPILMIVLGGVIIAAFFNALVSLTTYLADPYTELSAITFWLMGSLASASYTKVLVAAGPVLLATLVILAVRWRVNILSLGDEEARGLGLNPRRDRNVLIVVVAAAVAATVAVAGAITWVGLVVPHLVRLWIGEDHRRLLPASFLLGGAYLTVIDAIARSLTPGEIPLGVLTAMIGAPFFVLILIRHRRQEAHRG